jgi:hypothetical protein
MILLSILSPKFIISLMSKLLHWIGTQIPYTKSLLGIKTGFVIEQCFDDHTKGSLNLTIIII